MTTYTDRDLEQYVTSRMAGLYGTEEAKWTAPIIVSMLELAVTDRSMTVGNVATVLGWPTEQIATRLPALLDLVGVEQDSRGHIRPLTNPGGTAMPLYQVHWLDTDYVATMPGCAPDALVPVFSTGRAARVELPSGTTGPTVSIRFGREGRFEGVHPAGAVVVYPDIESPQPFSTWTRSSCATVLLFASATDASGWLDQHPGYAAYPVEFFVRAEIAVYKRILAQVPLPTRLNIPAGAG